MCSEQSVVSCRDWIAVSYVFSRDGMGNGYGMGNVAACSSVILPIFICSAGFGLILAAQPDTLSMAPLIALPSEESYGQNQSIHNPF